MVGSVELKNFVYCNTFIAKNADALATDLTNLMKSSSNTYVQQLYTKKVVSVVKKNGGTAKIDPLQIVIIVLAKDNEHHAT